MSVPVLATKLYIPPLRPKAIQRPRLIKKLNDGLKGKLTLISASAGFGKTTIMSEWVSSCGQPVAWLSLDDEHRDQIRFLTYLISAIQTIAGMTGMEILDELQSSQPPPTEMVLTKLINEIAILTKPFILILDDYHVVDSKEIDNTLTVLIENTPPLMHLVIATREDPHLPLSRLRGRGLLSELRASDMRFTIGEASEFLNNVMNLNLSDDDIRSLEVRTEGWIAGLQLAGISMKGQKDSSEFIESFTGSNHFILDYLIEEVLNQQPEAIQSFLIRTSILGRMCGSLCDSVLLDPAGTGRETLKYLEQSNIFIIPLDNDRHWYRYHHLFGEFLKLRLHSFSDSGKTDICELHKRGSQWLEDNKLYIEAFHHSVAARDIDRTIRLIEGNGIPRFNRGVVGSILDWLQSLPESELEKRPLLRITHASVLLGLGQISGVEEKLQLAEESLIRSEMDTESRDLVGRIASMRAIMAVTRYDSETIYTQSLRALEYLHRDNISSRTTSTWTLGQAYELMGMLSEAGESYKMAVSLGRRSKNLLFAVLSEFGLGDLQEWNNQLHLAKRTYENVLQQVGNQPLPVICDVYLGLARIHYQWNDLKTARDYGEKSLQLARKFESVIDRFIVSEMFMVRLSLAEGELKTASALLSETAGKVHLDNFKHRMPELAALQAMTSIKKGYPGAAIKTADKHNQILSMVQALLAAGQASTALKKLEPLYNGIDKEKKRYRQVRIMILQAIGLNEIEEPDKAVQILERVLTATEPEGFIRIFIDEGPPLAGLLSSAASRGIMPDTIDALQKAFNSEKHLWESPPGKGSAEKPVESLSPRELEVLELISRGYTNQEIGDKLFLALDTVKGHNRRIYGKLGVKTRTMALSKARSLRIINTE